MQEVDYSELGRLSARTPIFQCELPEAAKDRMKWWRGRREAQKGQPRSVRESVQGDRSN